ncbi:Uncharacterised protein [Mycobacteroides abscessus]|nr:Uncharacterised protein [Mycobacteroides abscessus]SII82927.1 Uncharacterised protein [Mycobacteroides abscessus subsp. abscessus]SKU43560.1 Uncharacterised protein [Mycobacteroides abscessus subsp. abscessus]
MSDSGATAIIWSAVGAKRAAVSPLDTATPMGTGTSGRSHSRAESTSK